MTTSQVRKTIPIKKGSLRSLALHPDRQTVAIAGSADPLVLLGRGHRQGTHTFTVFSWLTDKSPLHRGELRRNNFED